MHFNTSWNDSKHCFSLRFSRFFTACQLVQGVRYSFNITSYSKREHENVEDYWNNFYLLVGSRFLDWIFSLARRHLLP